MDHEWATARLKEFLNLIDVLPDFAISEGEDYDDLVSSYGSGEDVVDRLVTLDPVMRELMEAARPELGQYVEPDESGWSIHNGSYWRTVVRPSVLRAIGIHELGNEVRRRMQPDSPDLAADHLHPWVWEAAAPLWNAGSTQEAVHGAARSVNARLQQKLRRRDVSDSSLCREAFSMKDPAPGKPRLRFPGERDAETWRSRQQGAMEFGAGCFEGIRNPAAHEHEWELPEQVALEQLAVLSLLARWIDECTVEAADAVRPGDEEPAAQSKSPGTLASELPREEGRAKTATLAP